MKEKRIFFVDNKFKLIYNDKVITRELNNIVEKGMICQKEKFMEEFLDIVAKEKIKSKFLGEKLIVLKNSFYNSCDLFFLESIFNELGFSKVVFKDIRDFFKDKVTYIEFNDKYLVINFDGGLCLDLKYFKDIDKILDYFKEFMEDDVILFGTNDIIPRVSILGKNVYYYENFKSFIEDSLLKTNKYDV